MKHQGSFIKARVIKTYTNPSRGINLANQKGGDLPIHTVYGVCAEAHVCGMTLVSLEDKSSCSCSPNGKSSSLWPVVCRLIRGMTSSSVAFPPLCFSHVCRPCAWGAKMRFNVVSTRQRVIPAAIIFKGRPRGQKDTSDKPRLFNAKLKGCLSDLNIRC